MKKLPLILFCLLACACLLAMPFLCSHSSMQPERATEYYALKAQAEAANDNSPEAELMRLLLGAAAAPAVEATPSAPTFSWFGLTLAVDAAAMAFALLWDGFRKPALLPAYTWTAALAVPMGLLGARLIYCLVNLPFYVKDIAAPEAMLKLWEGGLSLAGTLFMIALAGLIGAKLGKASAGKVMDGLANILPALAVFSAFAAKTAGMLYGPETGFFLSVQVNGAARLDTALLLVLGMGGVVVLTNLLLKGKAAPDGHRFALTAFLYGTVMILLESLRRDGHMLWGFVHAEMILDMAIALPALLWLAGSKKRILWSLAASLVLSGVVIGLEFALDRSAIGDGLLYLIYAAFIGGYGALGAAYSLKRLNKPA